MPHHAPQRLNSDPKNIKPLVRWLDLVGPKGMPHHIGWRTLSKGEQGDAGDESMMTTLKGARHRSAVSRYFRSVVHNKATRDALSTVWALNINSSAFSD